ncbi:hypothetical protein Q5752_000422 [Cryptotrichosporon argae]
MSETYIDHKPFLSARFDVHEYANAVIQGRQYQPDADEPGSSSTALNSSARDVAAASGSTGRRQERGEKGDLGLEVAKLNYGIEDVTRQLRQEVSTSYPLLLTHLTTSLSLSSHLSPIRSSLASLSSSLDRLQSKIHAPHAHLALLVARLTRAGQLDDLARRASRFVIVSRRLEGQMERLRALVEREKARDKGKGKGSGKDDDGEREREVKEGEMAKAALSVAELDALLKPPAANGDALVGPADGHADGTEADAAEIPLTTLDFVRAYAPVVDEARDDLIREMEAMVIHGLAELDQTLLSSSLQTAHNLRLLPDLVGNLLADLNDAVTVRVRRAFDVGAIAKDVAGKDTSHSAIKFTARKSTEPSSSAAPLWASVLWTRLERVIDDIANCCIKVYTLEKVLRVKRDGASQVEFLEEVMKTLDEKPSFTFWTTLAKGFEAQSKDIKSQWLQQTLSTGYPRLLRLFHDFFAKIAVHTDTVYTLEHQSPETVLVLRSIAPFETLYLTRSTARMSDAAALAMQSYLAARGNPPGASEGVAIARVVTNELDSARFDPLLVRNVARNAAKVLDGFAGRIDGALVKDFTATSLIGPQATPAQQVNAQLVSCLYQARLNLSYVEPQFGAKVAETIAPSVAAFETAYLRTTDALDTAIRREMTAILARIHRVDFGKPVDPMAAGGSSPYMQDLTDKLAFLRNEVLGRMSLGEMMKEWVIKLAKHVIRTFLVHASIARPLGESGRLKLTGNMTELEMALQNFVATGQVAGQKGGVKLDRIGDEYLALRSFRQLLFAPRTALANPVETVHLPPLVVLHHITVLSPFKLPHELHGWSEAEYVGWLDRHTDEDAWKLVEDGIRGQFECRADGDGDGSGSGAAREDGGGDEQKERDEAWRLVQEVLEHARAGEDATPGA